MRRFASIGQPKAPKSRAKPKNWDLALGVLLLLSACGCAVKKQDSQSVGNKMYKKCLDDALRYTELKKALDFCADVAK